MTVKYIEITEEEFALQYPLIENHLNPSLVWELGLQSGGIFETYGDEYQFVRQQDPRQVWTLTDGDDGQMFLQSGVHFVNRVAYLISQRAVPAGVEIQVAISTNEDVSVEDEP